MKATIEMCQMLKAENTKLKQKLEEQTKTYQKILQEQQNEIDQLERNCDVFNEQMNDAVERATELQQEVDILQQQLQAYKNKEDKLREYITSYESISIIQGLNDTIKNKDLDEKTMIEMTNRYLEVHDKLLQILDGSDENE